MSPVLPPQLRAPKRTRGWGRFRFGGTLRKDGGVPPFGGRSRKPGATENQRRNKPRARAPASKRPQDHASPGPPSRRAAGPWGSGAQASPTTALPPRSGVSRPTRKRCPGACRRSGYTPDAPPARAHLPCTSLRMSWYRAHRCALGSAAPPAGAGAGAERGAPGQWAPGPGGPQPGQEGEDEAARGPPWSRRGIQRRAAALSPAPAMPAARRPRSPLPSGQSAAPPTARPPRWPRAPSRRPANGRGARSPSANGRAPRPGRGGRSRARRGGAGCRAPSPSLPRGPEVCAPLRYLLRPWRLFLSSSREVGIPKNGRPREAPDGQGLERRGPECCGSSWDPQSSFSLSALRSSRPFLHLLSSRPQILRPFPHF